MSTPEKKFDEESLRKKIREQLEKEHSEKSQFVEKKLSEGEIEARKEDESYYLEIYIRNTLEDEVYSQFAEFIECGNHLDQRKWLTPLELSEEFEFFPIEYTFFARIKNNLFSRKKIKVPDNPEITKMIEEFRSDILKDAQNRIQRYKDHIKENEIAYRSGHEKRILEEERERFYSSLKGYNKYKNHIGETTWMTEEEFEIQDEFTDRVYTTEEKVKYSLLFSVIVFLLITGITYLVSSFDKGGTNGYVLIEKLNQKASLYIDQNLAVGFTPSVPYPVQKGTHEIALLSSSFKTSPNFRMVEITTGDTTEISFQLSLIDSNTGTVRLNVPFKDAGIYVDGEFKGTIQTGELLNLPIGDHSITIKKPNYVASPRLHTFSLNAGDTIDLDFRMVRTDNTDNPIARNSALNLGLIEINSSVTDAKIILNGHDTGFTTDYILQKIPFGQHVVRVEKEGYKVYPKEQVITLTQNKRQAKVDFTLSSTTRYVTLQVKPHNAIIYIDGKKAGKGIFRGSLDLGEHDITFENLKNYKNPGPKKINVTKDGQDRFEFIYGSEIYYEISPGKVNPPSSDVRIASGYILKGINFKANSTNGPDIITNNVINQKVWNLGFAFQYKSPPGSDAIYIRFEVPYDLNIKGDIKLRMWLYGTDEDYPLAISSTSEYMIILNNKIVVERKTPRYSISQISENKYEEISIADKIKPGNNILIIACSPNNSQFINLWKIVIQ